MVFQVQVAWCIVRLPTNDWGATMQDCMTKPASMTTAERQRAYRERHANAAERINMLVSVSAKRALERLAKHNGQTQRAVLEDLLSAAEKALEI